MDREKIKSNTADSLRNVNKDIYKQITLSNDGQLLPYTDITKVINENEQFSKERKESTRYRLVNTVNSLFSNVLFNSTGPNSWATLNEPLFRDRTYPPNGISNQESEDFTFQESMDYHLKEVNGWFGYNNPRIYEYNNHEFTHMEPSKYKFNMVVREGEPNWGMTVTYPAEKVYNNLVDGGLHIVSVKPVKVGGKSMTAIGIPYKHNLSVNDNVELIDIGQLSGTYQVSRLGLDNGDYKNNYFVVDIPTSQVILDNSKFKKTGCDYYFRKFKRVNNQDLEPMTNNDFDIYPIAFSKNIFNDNVIQLSTKKDIDISGLKDNLGRPLSELYVTFIKSNNKGFTNVKSGLLLNNIDGISDHREIPDVRRIHNGVDTPFKSNNPLESLISIEDDEFIGDLVEYDIAGLKETVLAEAHHRFNTKNREKGGLIEGATILPDEVENEVVDENEEDEDIFNSFDDWDFNPWRSDTSDKYMYFLTYDATSKEVSCKDGELKVCYLNERGLGASNMMWYGVLYEQPVSGYYSDKTYIRYWDSNKSRFTTFERCDGEPIEESDTEEQIPEGGGNVSEPTTEEGTNIGSKQEGYYYKPFNKIKIREFSKYIEQGDVNTSGIPDYAEQLEDGTYIWRDLLDIGLGDNDLDYPFLNGSHYLYNSNILALRRQDPFGDYGLQYDGPIKDVGGKRMSNNKKIKRSGDVC